MDKTSDDRERLFPRSQRVIFEKAPLKQVVCQVRFPTILKIGETPADFQERVRQMFPLYEKGPEVNVPIATPLPPQVIQALRNQIGGMPHRFMTVDRSSTIILALESLSLSTSAYTRWEEFLNLFRSPLAALNEIYKPPFFSRVGLRYINQIERDKIGLARDRSWSNLIQDQVLGELSIAVFEKNADMATRQVKLTMPNNAGNILFQSGILGTSAKDNRAFMIDFDFSKEGQIGVNDAEPLLFEFHKLAGDAFRWAIKPELHDALDPKPAGDA